MYGNSVALQAVLPSMSSASPTHPTSPTPLPHDPDSLLCLVSQWANEHCKHIHSRISCHHSGKLLRVNPVAWKVCIAEYNDKGLICGLLAHLRNSQLCGLQGVVSRPAELGVCMHGLQRRGDRGKHIQRLECGCLNRCTRCSISPTPDVQPPFMGAYHPLGQSSEYTTPIYITFLSHWTSELTSRKVHYREICHLAIVGTLAYCIPIQSVSGCVFWGFTTWHRIAPIPIHSISV